MGTRVSQLLLARWPFLTKPRFLRPPKPRGQWPRMGQSTANVKIVGAKRRKLLHACPRAICAGPQRERRAPWPRPRAPKFCPSTSMVEATARKSVSETFGGIETRSGVHHSTTPIEPEHGCRSSAQDIPPCAGDSKSSYEAAVREPPAILDFKKCD